MSELPIFEVPRFATQLRPLGDKLAITPCSLERRIGRIVVPENKTTRLQTYHYARVLAAGPRCQRAKVGSLVYVSEYAGDEFTIEGKRVFLLRERDIVGVIEEPAEQDAKDGFAFAQA